MGSPYPKLSRLGDSIISKWTDKQPLLTSNLQGQLAGRIKNKCSLATFQQIRFNSVQHVWISIKEDWADTFDPFMPLSGVPKNKLLYTQFV